jgi:P pilus assembly chaperone PapD
VRLAPVSVHMPPDRPIASLKLTNERLGEAAFEAAVYRWTQSFLGENILEPTNDFAVAPSTFLVGPGQSQTVRLGAPAAFKGAGERSYRLIIRELPLGASAQAIRLRIEMCVPVFVRPRGAAPQLRVRPDADGSVRLHNTGDAHLKLFPTPDLPDPPRYLLAGAEIVRPPPQDASALLLRFAGPDALAAEERMFSLPADAGRAVPGR